MAKGIYIGVSSKARKIKKLYIGVSSKARKIKKAYIGVGGKARLFYSAAGRVTYEGTTSLSTARYEVGGAGAANTISDTATKYAFFAGGHTGYSSVVDAFNSSLTRTTAGALSQGRRGPTGASNGSYVYFIGGRTSSTTAVNRIDYYSSSGTTRTGYKSNAYTVYFCGAGNFGNKAVWGGGATTMGTGNEISAVYYATGTTVSTATSLSTAVWAPLFGANASVCVIGGGRVSSGSETSIVNIYNSSMTRSTGTILTTATREGTGASTPKYAYLGGGYGGTAMQRYNTSGTKTTLSNLPTSAGGWRGSATALSEYAIFAKGCDSDTDAYASTIAIYDESGTLTTNLSMSIGGESAGAAIIGNYALFAGGWQWDDPITTVEIIKVET